MSEEERNLLKEIRQEYDSELADLTFNSRILINNLTTIAKEHLDENPKYCVPIVEAICDRIANAHGEKKMPYFYLMDCICKIVGKDYLQLFSSRLQVLFIKAYESVDPATKESLRHLYETWPETFKQDLLDLLGQFLKNKKRKIEGSNPNPKNLNSANNMIQYPSNQKSQYQNYSQNFTKDQFPSQQLNINSQNINNIQNGQLEKQVKMTIDSILESLTQKLRTQTVSPQEQVSIFQLVNTLQGIAGSIQQDPKSALEKLSQLGYSIPNNNLIPNNNNLIPNNNNLILNNNNLISDNNLIPNNNNLSSDNNLLSSNNALLKNLNNNPNLISTMNPPNLNNLNFHLASSGLNQYRSMQHDISSLLSNQNFIFNNPNQNIPHNVNQIIHHNKNYQKFPVKRNTQTIHNINQKQQNQNVSSSKVQNILKKKEINSNFELNSKLLNTRNDKIIERFYLNQSTQCKTCGLRFIEKEMIDTHLDWHFEQNRKDKSKGKISLARDWFLDQNKWYEPQTDSQYIPYIPSNPVIFVPNEKKEEKIPTKNHIYIEADENHPNCALCDEPFKQDWNEENEAWMFVDATKQDGKYFHIKCLDKNK